MIGAIIGDMVGSPYEFDWNNIKTKDFPLFSPDSGFTDDTVMTMAVAKAILDTDDTSNDEALRRSFVRCMQDLGNSYPDAGYGFRFLSWLDQRHPEPYGSYGNGSAMRVSPVAWLFHTMEDVRRVARLSAEVTHNHPEGIKGAEATAAAIFLARTGHSKAEIRDYMVSEFGYDLSRTCDEIRPTYRHVESCQGTVPEAITAFLEGESFEDVLRTAVSLGGDSDTLTAIAGSIAEGFYGVPEEIREEMNRRLPE
ncbi:MAG: ADP-ribosylglycohydrolase family protein, partial [Oscillospiraceae bacterium]|nr:ADP-ribosylglycohydrolase family protein [Oscillospiraceae bacterium]